MLGLGSIPSTTSKQKGTEVESEWKNVNKYMAGMVSHQIKWAFNKKAPSQIEGNCMRNEEYMRQN
jgi:hypothetical protein